MDVTASHIPLVAKSSHLGSGIGRPVKRRGHLIPNVIDGNCSMGLEIGVQELEIGDSKRSLLASVDISYSSGEVQ
jgi:hypothetical protein